MSGLGDLSLFELFKAEAESNCTVLNTGLLAIEEAPEDLAQVEPLMRAAHSIKGAARIIGLDLIVTLAHAMEDCLVAVQKGKEQLTSGRVDQLLRGTDVLERISQLAEDEVPSWSEAQGSAVHELTEQLRSPPPTIGTRRPSLAAGRTSLWQPSPVWGASVAIGCSSQSSDAPDDSAA